MKISFYLNGLKGKTSIKVNKLFKKENIFNNKMKKNIYYSLTGILILSAILLVINLISNYIFLRFDFTDEKIYSLSKASKKIAASLPDKLIIKAYFSKELPAEYSINKRYLQDLLAEYKTYSKGNVSYEFIDPLAKNETLEEIRQLGIPPVRFTTLARDKYEIKEGFMGLVFIHGEKKEVIPIVKSMEGMEYDITSTIKKLVAPELKTIGFTAGHSEANETDSEVEAYLKSQYNVKYIDTTKEKEIPKDVSSLLIVSPKKEFTAKEVFMLDQYLLKGKPIAFLTEKYVANMQSFYASQVINGLDGFLEYYGIKIKPALVLDTQCQKIAVRSVQGMFIMQNVVEYQFLPIATDIDRTNPITKSMDSLTFAFISPIEITQKDNFEIKPFVKSSRDSWCTEKVFSINPFMQTKRTKSDIQGPFTLAVTVLPKPGKKYISYFSDKTPVELAKLAGNVQIQKESSDLGRMLVLPNSGFIKDNPVLFLNIVDWVSQDEALISIRSKGSPFRPLKKTSDFVRILVKYLAIFLMPVLVIGYGIYRWKARNTIKKNLKSLYA
ncbi:MAG: hypothetical protein A2252_00260 [Elusimicrobia bacterium RIFOXYA2_FULL_39_19]|nr:MAG: hypothetical protein A2252_00260 [Elusimicrobia bacterium RIFOXYA2_FULL_39_19]